MKYIHCSWDILEPDSLVPRVPETIITGPNLTEDSKTPRICVAGSVQDALKSIPGCGIMIRNMRKYHIPLIIHAYYLEQDPQYVYKPTDAEVPDAAYTGEYWMLRSPQKVRRRDYLLFDPVCISGKDPNGTISEFFVDCKLKPVPLQDTYSYFLESLPFSVYISPDIMNWKQQLSFRKLMLNMDEEFYRMILDMQIQILWTQFVKYLPDWETREKLPEVFAFWDQGTRIGTILDWFDANYSERIRPLRKAVTKRPKRKEKI